MRLDLDQGLKAETEYEGFYGESRKRFCLRSCSPCNYIRTLLGLSHVSHLSFSQCLPFISTYLQSLDDRGTDQLSEPGKVETSDIAPQEIVDSDLPWITCSVTSCL
jgi:hypothetical protein